VRFFRRAAQPADLPAIVSIYNHTIPSRKVTADLEPVSVASREAWFAEHAAANRPLWVAEDDEGHIAAWLSFSDFNRRPAYAGTAELSIYVREDCRRQGLGRQLLADAIEVAPKLGLHSLIGLIFGHNQPSLSLFNAFGFTSWGMLPRVAVMDGREYDLVIVGRRVD
jgi:phosphinothricin acetyltransferase